MVLPDRLIVLLVRVILFFVYLAVGAAIFQALENTNQKTSFAIKQETRRRIQEKYNISKSDLASWKETFKSNLQYQGEEEVEWNFGNSFLFAAVTITTIGYGNVAPSTFEGRLFCIVYAFIGIPGSCLTLKVIGDSIYDMGASFITLLEQRILKRRKTANIELKTSLFNVLMTIVVVLPLLAFIVYVREKPHWNYFQCFYFTFITLTTIGYGDYVPHFGKSLDFLLLIVALMGLAFVSSILCSLNNLYESYGLSKRVVKSIKHTDEEEDNADEEGDTLSELPRRSITPRPSLAKEKRGSVTIGMIQA